jgi:hypothetical protein
MTIYGDVMIDYLSERQNPLRNTDTAELNMLFDTLVAEFTKDWLAAGGDNPVQTLWARKDDLATIELTLLGHAIHRLQRVDPRWVGQQVKKIKGKDRNERQGALYELLALSLFDDDGIRVQPARKGNPGYDGTVFLPENIAIKASLKNSMIRLKARMCYSTVSQGLRAIQSGSFEIAPGA